jgi:UDP-N-acetyl-D-mannosaminuronate dehydrogenase
LKSAIIGLGETGQPLYELLRKAYPTMIAFDTKTMSIKELLPVNIDVLNICIPYDANFLMIVNDYIDIFYPGVTVIHSTVPIGTTRKLKNAVHSPILGKHDKMYEDIKNFRKWIGGELADVARDYFQAAGLWCSTVPTSEETEALKLMCLAKYGMSIAFAQYQKEICDKYGFSYNDVIEWDANYNANVASWLKRPILTPPEGKIGGHCVAQNTKILNEQHPNPILEEILKYA